MFRMLLKLFQLFFTTLPALIFVGVTTPINFCISMLIFGVIESPPYGMFMRFPFIVRMMIPVANIQQWIHFHEIPFLIEMSYVLIGGILLFPVSYIFWTWITRDKSLDDVNQDTWMSYQLHKDIVRRQNMKPARYGGIGCLGQLLYLLKAIIKTQFLIFTWPVWLYQMIKHRKEINFERIDL
ncbi:hypothetical protein [Lactococcus petauri]|uniref:hypothetical protein n=1 Tax=Lactococcus petauri TaxID=1940789 RepID=UPI001F59425D|nr:hypothetical protein [Lactococcus petauri]